MTIQIKKLNTNNETEDLEEKVFCLYGSKTNRNHIPTYSLTYYSTSIKRFDPALKPYNVRTYLESNQDITIEFDVENETLGVSYEVNALNSTGLYSLWSNRTDTHSAVLPYNQRQALGLGTYLKILIIPTEGEPSTIVDVDTIPR